MSTASDGSVLLTGASGFVGKPTLAALRARGFQVHALARRMQAEKDANWISADLLNPEARRHVMETLRPTHLVHLAWYTEHNKFWNAPENEAWRDASIDLIERFAANGGRRVVLVGTCAEYDWDRQDSHPWLENDSAKPASAYGRAKLAVAEAAMAIAAQHKLSIACARLFLMFGAGEDRQRFLPSVIRGLLAGQEIPCSSGRQVRDFSDVRDVGSAVAALLAANVTGTINIASGRAATLADICRIVVKLTGGSETLLKFGALPDRIGETPFMVADVTRLRHELQFVPPETLEQRLAAYVDLYR